MQFNDVEIVRSIKTKHQNTEKLRILTANMALVLL